MPWTSVETATADLNSQHIAIHFARAGANLLVLAGRNAQDLDDTKAIIQKAASKCAVLCVPTDITDSAAVAHLFKQAGKIDILINNAGFTGDFAPLAETDSQDWWLAFVCCPLRLLLNV